MPLKQFNPTTPSQRNLVLVDKSALHKGGPVKKLTEGLTKSGGRNNSGHVTAWQRGGGHKRRYRMIDFKRRKQGVPAVVDRIEYDPNRTAFIALITYEDGEQSYILAPQRLAVGDKVEAGIGADIKPGNALSLANIPVGTLVHNVETVYWIREIFEKGGKWFSSHGRNGRKGLRTFSVSGFVQNPGIKLTDAGITINQLIEEHCGGMLKGHRFKGYLPGGASGGILPASLGDIPLDFDTLQEYNCFIGSAAIVVLSDKTNMKEIGLNLMRFFEDESCGQCTPCRNGTSMAVKLMKQKSWNKELLTELSKTMNKASICGLGQAAPNPLQSIIRHFKEDIN